ncbi:aldehyde dehydrogenase [Ornithinibacillus massiliensis]|uniref:Aldehyde dehydrogenase n=1 Tax=Ornithinibacillus massiliensis TaxID=1944633 RepID=A0ABS5MBD9_9BACI|nr:aldehyde dehydrogenase [Ornithinibacillus massiliensis]MBS3679646.1 aldehyde dehydrogenase [Ornithinibacillus massiliensis]
MNIQQLVENQRNFFLNEHTLDYRFRIDQLRKLRYMLEKYEKNIYQALRQDLNKSTFETFTTELGFLYNEIKHLEKNLKEWMKDEPVDAPLTHKGTKSYIRKEPYGVTLVISPWNYPLHLAIAPAIGAIAAGNTVIIKPSEYSPSTSSLLAKMVKETFDPSFLTVVEGAKETSEALLNQRLDYIFFTGSTPVGKIVMRKASEYLTPVTLELGGKSPVIVDRDANISITAKRIVWGKFLNAGQTCVAPDYIYVHCKMKDKLIKEMKKQIKKLYKKDALTNKDYVRIVNEKHFHRLSAYLSNGVIAYGGNTDNEQLKIEPTILDQITWEDPVMQDEIFGPILPILTFETLDDAIADLKRREKPLALYYFGEKESNQEKVMTSLSFGGGCINDTLYHLANPNLPFGGVGSSGIGSYHGKYSFHTFSHQKSILKQTTKMDIPLRYPGGKLAFSLIKKILK